MNDLLYKFGEGGIALATAPSRKTASLILTAEFNILLIRISTLTLFVPLLGLRRRRRTPSKTIKYCFGMEGSNPLG